MYSASEIQSGVFSMTAQSDPHVRFRKVYFAAFAFLLLAINIGQMYAFSATGLTDMDREDSPVRPSNETKTWIASSINVGELVGSLLGVPLSQKFGRRTPLLVTAGPLISGWLMIAFAKEETLLLCGRTLTGICCGLIVTIVPMFLVEISTTKTRGRLGASFAVCLVSGTFLGNLIGWFVHWNTLALYSTITPLLSFGLMCFVPESPRWLVSKGQQELAVRSLTILHGSMLDPVKEVSLIEENLRAQSPSEGFRLSDMRNTIFWKPMVLSLILLFFREMSGITVVLNYATEIFQSTATAVNKNLATVIISCVQIVMTLVTAIIVDRVRRRIILTISAIGAGLGLTLLGTFFYLKHFQFNAQNEVFTYVPIISLITYVAFHSIGFASIPWIMVNELSPLKGRSFISGLCVFFRCLLAFVISKTFYDLRSALGEYGPFWIYGAFILSSVPFIWIFLPETKGKSLEDILKIFTVKNDTSK